MRHALPNSVVSLGGDGCAAESTGAGWLGCGRPARSHFDHEAGVEAIKTTLALQGNRILASLWDIATKFVGYVAGCP